MNELASILERRRGAGPGSVLATVVHVRGSAYRRPGARMLVCGDGSRLGTISGGCLETDVARKAWWWTDEGAAIRVFDNSVEDAARDFGLGCNGVITVLLERLGTPSVELMLDFLAARQARREASVVATVVRASAESNFTIGDRVLFDPRGIVLGGNVAIVRELAAAVARTFGECRSRLVHLAGYDVFVEWVGPPQRLFVFGAGHDVVPLAGLASMMGWDLTVADIHANQLDPSRFPSASRLFQVPLSGDLTGLDLGAADAVVVMTHNFPQDAMLLPQLLARKPRYLGLLGPRSRAERLFEETGCGAIPTFVYAPVGLAIGGDQPEGIALAIASEIQAVLHDQPGASLRRRHGAIHEPALELGSPEAERGRWRPDETVAPVCSVAHA